MKDQKFIDFTKTSTRPPTQTPAAQRGLSFDNSEGSGSKPNGFYTNGTIKGFWWLLSDFFKLLMVFEWCLLGLMSCLNFFNRFSVVLISFDGAFWPDCYECFIGDEAKHRSWSDLSFEVPIYFNFLFFSQKL